MLKFNMPYLLKNILKKIKYKICLTLYFNSGSIVAHPQSYHLSTIRGRLSGRVRSIVNRFEMKNQYAWHIQVLQISIIK